VGILPQQQTHVAYLPLVDRLPAHHNTFKTAMEKGSSLVRAGKEDFLIFTADQQLYKIVIDVMFHNHQGILLPQTVPPGTYCAPS